MILERTAHLEILTDDTETYYRISYNDEPKYVSWFRREYSILYPVDNKLYDILTQKHFEISKQQQGLFHDDFW
jgi:hypothetical protein